eukprot:CAMPEP_0197854284 /NCGR_PEP_ID=MMETSP1438-20131217/24378_1 /TAXON_ID=1461541 /ORGANISM="Pterosperma sp., Strain CCMP1384" /LENGTH=377 /DNA_ID=CAMNT_0043468967 /DNA_START=99 /DNA_END=1229 /DNA_ORIENTATION=+
MGSSTWIRARGSSFVAASLLLLIWRPSLATADTSLPSFDSSYPRVHSVTSTEITLALSLNEVGHVYYAVVPKDHAAPSIAELKAQGSLSTSPLSGVESCGVFSIGTPNSALSYTIGVTEDRSECVVPDEYFIRQPGFYGLDTEETIELLYPKCKLCPKLYPGGEYDIYLLASDAAGNDQTALPGPLTVLIPTATSAVDGIYRPPNFDSTIGLPSVYQSGGTYMKLVVTMEQAAELAYVVTLATQPPPDMFSIFAENGITTGIIGRHRRHRSLLEHHTIHGSGYITKGVHNILKGVTSEIFVMSLTEVTAYTVHFAARSQSATGVYLYQAVTTQLDMSTITKQRPVASITSSIITATNTAPIAVRVTWDRDVTGFLCT